MLGSSRFPASRIMAMTYGIQCAFLGIMHGYLEILHGSTSTGGLLIDANSNIANSFYTGIEPALTVIPNFLITGIVAVTVGIVVLAVAIVIEKLKHSGVILIVLSIVLLVTGGGFTSIPFGIFAGICGIVLEVHSRRKEYKKATPARRAIANLWLPLFLISMVWYFYLDFFGFMLRMESTTVGVIGLGICLFAIVAGFVRDSQLKPVLGI